MKAYLPSYLKTHNRKVIFDLLLHNKTMSRAEIVSITGMSFTTVSNVVDFLLENGIVRETDDAASSPNNLGRKRKSLRLCDDVYFAQAVNYEGEYLESAFVDLAGRTYDYQIRPAEGFLDPEVQRKMADELLEQRKTFRGKVLGVGLGLPMDVNPVSDEVYTIWNDGNRFARKFQDVFSGFGQIADKILIGNDANFACAGELYSRKVEEDRSGLCYLSLGTGLGAGFAFNGRIWEGDEYRSGEIGNMILQPTYQSQLRTARELKCENLINIQALENRFGVHFVSQEPIGQHQITEIIDYILPVLSTVIYNVVQVMDIEHFTLSGIVPDKLGEELRTRLAEQVNRMLQDDRNRISINGPACEHNVLVGAASMVFQKTILKEFS
jgi:predicted NBD/HSP70 family sugar kinase/predicted transcriptional regulator